MLSFDILAFEKAMEKADVDVERDLFRRAIDKISAQFFIDLEERDRKSINFHAYFYQSLQELGVDPDIQESYSSALGRYFNLQKQRRGRGRLRATSAIPMPQMPNNRVEEAATDSARIRVTLGVSIVFRALKDKKRLTWNEIREESRVLHFGFPTQVNDILYQHAKKQALAVMNSKRMQK